MKKRTVVLLFGFVLLTVTASVAMLALDTQADHGKPEPPAAGVHWAKGQKPSGGGAPASPNLVNHGGPIMIKAVVSPIFWGASWANSTFVGDKIDGINTFYSGIGGSLYAQTSDEYADGHGTPVTDGITNATPRDTNNNLMPTIDLSAAKGGSQTTAILAEVCKVIKNSPVPNGYYPVYVDVKRGNAGFCAWHSSGTCTRGGAPVQFAFFFNLDLDAGCDPQDTSGLHSQGLAAIANVSGHELSEARSDPSLNAWYDRSGQENADKCAWTFGTPLETFGKNGSQWKIQGNWSNNAFNSKTGYPNASGQNGCIN